MASPRFIRWTRGETRLQVPRESEEYQWLYRELLKATVGSTLISRTPLLRAVWQRPGRTPVILHSDRGCQFTSEEYQRFLEAHHITCSMRLVGNCADNAADESFFGVLKRERVNRQQYRTRAEARADIFDSIERCHNPRQRRRLDMQQQEQQRLFTQPSVISG